MSTSQDFIGSVVANIKQLPHFPVFVPRVLVVQSQPTSFRISKCVPQGNDGLYSFCSQQRLADFYT